MKQLSELRKIEVKIVDVWTPVHMGQIEAGDVIRLFEPDGSPVTHNGKSEFMVTARPGMQVDFLDSES